MANKQNPNLPIVLAEVTVSFNSPGRGGYVTETRVVDEKEEIEFDAGWQDVKICLIDDLMTFSETEEFIQETKQKGISSAWLEGAEQCLQTLKEQSRDL